MPLSSRILIYRETPSRSSANLRLARQSIRFKTKNLEPPEATPVSDRFLVHQFRAPSFRVFSGEKCEVSRPATLVRKGDSPAEDHDIGTANHRRSYPPESVLVYDESLLWHGARHQAVRPQQA